MAVLPPVGLTPTPADPVAPDEVASGRPVWRLVLDVFLENRLAIAGLVIVVFMFLFCFVGPLLYQTDQVHVALAQGLRPPTASHLLGSDGTGRDMLGRLMLGGQTSLEVGLAAAVIATSFGALWGALAGFTGGVVDSIMMRLVDGLLSVPALFLLLFLASLTSSTVTLVLVVALISWLAPARLVRGETLSLRGLDYVKAVTVMGGGRWRSILRHIIPNTIGTIIVNVTFQIADAILTVATLSFLGLGVRPPSADWGSLLSNGVTYTANGDWWLVYPPGVAIVLTVVAFNFIGDALRDGLSARMHIR